MSQGLPGTLTREMRQTFVELVVFESDASLRKFFNRTSLRPWMHSVPEASTPLERAELLIHAFYSVKRVMKPDSEWSDGMVVLDIFIVELYQHCKELGLPMDKLEELIQKMPEVQEKLNLKIQRQM